MGPYVVVFSDTTFDTKCMLFFHIPANSMTLTGSSTIQFPPYLPRIRVRSHELRGSVSCDCPYFKPAANGIPGQPPLLAG